MNVHRINHRRKQREKEEARIRGLGAFSKLPGELRNRIWRLAVVDHKPYIDVVARLSKSVSLEPGLLRCSKALRAESGSIFFAENTFHVLVFNYDARASRFMLRKRVAIYEEFNKLIIRQTSRLDHTQPHWRNLVDWLHCVHQQRAVHLAGPARACARGHSYLSLLDKNIGRMFQMVYALRGTPWAKVESLLKDDREVLGTLDKRWLEDSA